MEESKENSGSLWLRLECVWTPNYPFILTNDPFKSDLKHIGSAVWGSLAAASNAICILYIKGFGLPGCQSSTLHGALNSMGKDSKVIKKQRNRT